MTTHRPPFSLMLKMDRGLGFIGERCLRCVRRWLPGFGKARKGGTEANLAPRQDPGRGKGSGAAPVPDRRAGFGPS